MANSISIKKAKRLYGIFVSPAQFKIKATATALKLSRNTVKRYYRKYISTKSQIPIQVPTIEELFILTNRKNAVSLNKTPLKKESKWKANILKDGDFEVLMRWEKSKSRKKWERAITISNAHAGVPATEIAKKINRHQDTIAKWIRSYDKKGIEAFQRKRKTNELIQQTIVAKKQNLIKLIHETPQLHGINRTVWGIQSLSDAYSGKKFIACIKKEMCLV